MGQQRLVYRGSFVTGGLVLGSTTSERRHQTWRRRWARRQAKRQLKAAQPRDGGRTYREWWEFAGALPPHEGAAVIATLLPMTPPPADVRFAIPGRVWLGLSKKHVGGIK